MTSAEKVGGQEMQQICGQTVQILRTEGEGVKNPKILWTSYMEASSLFQRTMMEAEARNRAPSASVRCPRQPAVSLRPFLVKIAVNIVSGVKQSGEASKPEQSPFSVIRPR